MIMVGNEGLPPGGVVGGRWHEVIAVVQVWARRRQTLQVCPVGSCLMATVATRLC